MMNTIKPLKSASSLLMLLMVLAGCSVAPTYQKAEVTTPAAYKEVQASSNSSNWKEAQPAEEVARGDWWKIFADDSLNEMEVQAMAANQNLKAAAARLKQSRALRQDARAGLFPQVNAGLGANRGRAAPASQGLPDNTRMPTSTTYNAQLGASYELDLFGRVASSIDAATADTQKNEALFQSVQLALQADVAQAYFLLRELDAEQALYAATVELRSKTLKLVQTRFKEGDISELDLARAKAELATAQSESLGLARSRAVAEHALAVLLGKTPAEFNFLPRPLSRIAVNIPAGLPSDLLERRPDIASAERSMAAANARIGVARSAFFPRLDITGSAGYASASLGDFLNWSSRTFLLGPLLSMPLFDGGRRQASVDRAGAVYEEDVANYRQTVLNAFREVEDNLADLRILRDQTQAQDNAVQAAERAAKLSHVQYREGSVSYLNVIDADRTVLQQQRIAAQLDGARAKSAVSLIRALGGGWDGRDGHKLAEAADKNTQVAKAE
ncbi:efflux transporter outer membrane subunit [Undibacterium sp. JH2W]|uniref:efflux transporter outer membrane subunit n=1 Tax=Undibacterium sp. JH2W TaxID=3413037 RepID=UPI003BF18C20